MKQCWDVLTIGGGVVGLSASIGMAERGFSVAIIDAGSFTVNPQKIDSRVYAINQASKQLFMNLDIWNNVDKTRCSPYQRMHVWDEGNGEILDFNSRLIASNQLGEIIEESIIKHALLTKIKTLTNIQLFDHKSIDYVQNDQELVKIKSNKQEWTGKLLIAADGANSPVRKQLNIPVTSWPYHQQALVAMVNVEKQHQQTAWQIFNKNGTLAFLPLKDPHTCSIVWSTTPNHAKTLMNLNKIEFNDALTAAFEQKLGQVSLLGKIHQFPLIMRHAKQYSGSNWLLAGDAAHSIHPLAGLGLNLGLADVSCWLTLLDQTKSLNRCLAQYQRQRKTEVWKVIMFIEGIKTLFTNPLTPVKMLRGLGLKSCNNINFIKRFLINQAMQSP